MDESDTQVVRINVPVKKPADVTIDLRQDGLMHLFTVDSMERFNKLNSPSNDSAHSTERHTVGEGFDVNGNDLVDPSSHPMEPSTIIHLKIVPHEGNKLDKEETNSGTSSVCGEKNASSVSSESNQNKNCLRVRSSLCEMHKEKRIQGTDNHNDEQTNILKEFEINRQLERLRTEKKKIVRRRYTRHMERSTNNNRHNSPKSEISDKSTNNILSIFNDGECEMLNPAVSSICNESTENTPSINRTEPMDGQTHKEAVDSTKNGDHLSTTPKRKGGLLHGPQSKKFRAEENPASSELEGGQRCWVTFASHVPKVYCNGQTVAKDFRDGHSPKSGIPLVIRIRREEGEDFSQIGLESLRLWKLNEEEIAELKKQVKEEWEHKQKEHIMPLILSMSPDQIESTYIGMKDVMKMYDITEQDSDDDESQPSNENLEEEGKMMEFKSLDALYREEFSKKYYRDLFKTSDGKNAFWKSEDEQQEDQQTNYSRNRPKRSSVDYTPSAYAFIGFMEGRRFGCNSKGSRRGNSHRDGTSNKGTSSGDDFMSDCDRSFHSCDESINRGGDDKFMEDGAPQLGLCRVSSDERNHEGDRNVSRDDGLKDVNECDSFTSQNDEKDASRSEILDGESEVLEAVDVSCNHKDGRVDSRTNDNNNLSCEEPDNGDHSNLSKPCKIVTDSIEEGAQPPTGINNDGHSSPRQVDEVTCDDCNLDPPNKTSL